ncbi:MAG: AAA family ATPase [Cytophagales bacterium]|nr:AAA family ATPase [Cytophagales bacterium]
MIYSTDGIKGGSGKSTIATNLAIILSQSSKDVLLVDADDQATASSFTGFRSKTKQGGIGYTSIQLAGKAVREQILRLKEKYDDIVIDVGGRDTTSQRAAMSVAGIFLVPFLPRSFDIWTLKSVVKIIEEMKIVNPTLKAYSFINRADFRGSDNKEVEDFLKEEKMLVFIDTPIGNRKAFSNAGSQGLGVTEVKPVDPKAVEEFHKLITYLTSI